MAEQGKIVLDGYPFRRYRLQGVKGTPKYSVLRRYLIEKYKYCYYCGIECKNYPVQPHPNGGFYIPNRPDLGTIEHLVPRPPMKGHLGRGKYQKVAKVLACYKCNQERNVEYIGAQNGTNTIREDTPA